MTSGAHTLVVYGASPRADAVIRGLAEAAAEHGGRLTVLSLLIQESEKNGCCDTRSVLWNDVLRGLASEDLARARLAVEDDAGVELDVLAFSGRRAADAVTGAALERNADAIVLADVRAIPCAGTATPAPQEPGAGGRGRSGADRSGVRRGPSPA